MTWSSVMIGRTYALAENLFCMEGLSEERVLEIAQAFLAARQLLPEQPQFINVPIPVNVPSMARRIAGDVLGWPLHLRHRAQEDTMEMGPIGTPMVMPIMRHKPSGVSLLETRRRVPRNKNAEDSVLNGQDPHPIFGGDYEPKLEGSLADDEISGFGVGTAVKKYFDGELYTGTVAKIDDFPSGRFYLIIYDDGNQEHITAEELEKIAV